MFLSDVSIKRPVFATMMMVTLVVLGIAGYRRLAIDEYPDVSYPVVVAQTTYPGASPEVMEREVSRPIEEALNTVQGIQEITSTSLEGSSLVRVQLQLGVNVMEAQQEVQSKIARMRRQLPEDIEDPVIIRFDPNERAIMSIAVQSGDRPMRELTELADEVISTRLEAIPGVGGVNLIGGTDRQIQIQLNPDAMRAYAISPPQVMQALQRENQEVPAGRVRRGDQERLVRITGRVEDPRTFRDITVAVRNGVPVRLGDVATVVDGTAEARSASYLNDGRALSVEILKISGSNTVEVADRVRTAVAELQEQLPTDVKMSVVSDDSRRIRASLESVQHELILGAVLCIAIIYFFLNSWRSTIITGLALPISIISAYFGMWIFGFTINTMTLLALSLAIGLLIDDAIVVRENIVRHVEMGKDHYRAAREGTSEIGLAVVSTTMAVIAVFIPVAFMGGQIGLIFFQFGVVVAFAVVVSLFVSFTLDPMLSSVWPDPEVENHGPGRKRGNIIQRAARRFNDGFERVADRYPRWLGWALDHRKTVLGFATACIIASGLIIPQLGFTWVPDFDGGEFNVNFRVAPGSRLEYTVERGHQLATVLRSMPEVDFTYMSIGGGFRGTPNTGRVFVKLKEKDERDRTQAEIQDELRRKLAGVPGVRANITGTPTIFGGFRQPIQVNVQGPEQERLKLASPPAARKARSRSWTWTWTASRRGRRAWASAALPRRCSRCSPASAPPSGRTSRATRTTWW
jgi:HAE1 family hydrophobic/amphiphilic exporter-1